MSFTSDVKRELCGCEVPDTLRDTLRYGLMYGFKGEEPYFMTHDKTASGFVRRVFPKHTTQLQISKTKSGQAYCIVPLDRFLPLAYKYYDSGIDAEFAGGSDIQAGIFLRGVFMTCGSVTVQKAGYHFELCPGKKGKCESLYRFITERGMNVSISHRASTHYVYSKDSESIADIMTFMGAVQSSMEIMNIKIYKEMRSSINRSVNCETANIDRTVRASTKQLEDIRLVMEHAAPDKLPDDLREICTLRLENPDMSLRDLGKLIVPNITRSGVNHRFERLAKLADEIRGNM